jgi:hypothetical protein
MRRPTFCQSVEFGYTLWLVALILFTPPLALSDSGRVLACPAQTLRGWGMSLAWEANDLYGGGRQPAQIKDPNIQSRHDGFVIGPLNSSGIAESAWRGSIAGAGVPHITQTPSLRDYRYSHEAQVMGSSLAVSDTVISLGGSLSSWQLYSALLP